MKTYFLTFALLLMTAAPAFAQPANDACAGAQSLGNLPAPSGCPGGIGTPQNYNLNNIGATAENPYGTIVGCQGLGGDMATPAADVWYSFVASSTELDVSVAGLISPSLGLYEGTNCGALTPRGCNTGNGQALFTPLTPGNTYYLQISGQDEFDTGNFTLTLNNWTNCAQCITNATLTVTPTPTNGSYQGGTTVTFCFQIDGYVQQSTNWLSAVVPSFGAGWDMSTLTPGAPPAALIGSGSWIWTNNVTSTATGLTSTEWGWYFDLDNDGNPGNNFGDTQWANDPTGGNGLTAGPWQPFCWTITANDCPPGSNGDDLSMNINTLADGEIGSWSSLGCVDDPTYDFAAALICCDDPIMTAIDVLCNGGNDGSATATAVGTGPYDYVWTQSGAAVATNNGIVGPNTIPNLTAGTYDVTVTDTYTGCITTGTAIVNEPTAVTAVVTPIDANCGALDGSASVVASNGTAGYTYAWFSDPGLTVPLGNTTASVTGLGAGTYYAEVTDNNGCIVVANGAITNASGPAINGVAFTDPLCAGDCNGTITVTVTGGTAPLTYDIGGPTQANGNFTGVCDGAYTITVTDFNGCQSTSNATLTDPLALSATNVVVDLLCFGTASGSITITAAGGTAPLQYSLNGGALGGSNVFNGLSGGNFTILVADANGCQVNDAAVINEPAELTMILSPSDVFCNGACTGSAISIPSGGTPPLIYNWSSGGNAPQELNLCAGNFTLTLTDANACVFAENFVIAEPTLLAITTTTVVSTCGVDDGTATATATGGSGGNTFEWYSDGGLTLSIGQPTANATNLAVGTYYVEVTDLNGCTASIVAVIGVAPGIVFGTALPTNETCPGSCDGQIEITTAGATGYSIDGGATFVPGNVFTGLCPMIYQLAVQDANGCTDVGTTVIGSPNPVFISSDSDTIICIGGTATLTAIGAPVGSIYTWDNGLGVGQTHLVNPLVTTVYIVSAADANGCPSNDVPVVVEINPPLSVVALTSVEICIGNSATISALAQGGDGGPYNYDWDDGAGWIASGSLQTVSPTVTTTYNVTASDGCETPDASAQVTITVNPLPTVDFVADNTSGCVPLVVNFANITPPSMVGNNCIWDFGDGTFSSDCATPQHVYTAAGCYDITLTLTSPQGCPNTITYPDMVCASPFPVAEFTYGPQPTTILNPEIQFTDQSTGANIVNWFWDFAGLGTSGEVNPSFEFPSTGPGTYNVCLTVTNSDGCDSTVCHPVIINGEFLIYVPNSFTPDNDGVNDYFFASGTGLNDAEDFTLYIFNRWGELIWESHNPDYPWDGRYKGVDVQQDVYVWRLIATDPYTREKHELIGHVSVLR